MSTKTFYCQNVCGSDSFDIEEWNEVQKSLEQTNLPEAEKLKILFPPACEKQCFDCMANVGQQRLKTQKLIEKMQSKSVRSNL